MIDLTVLEALALASPDARDAANGEVTTHVEKIRKIFASALKRVCHGEPTSSRISLALRLPYFIAVVGLCEVFMHVFATKDVRDAFIYHPRKKCELWRFVTYMLLHRDGIHLALNVIIQSVLAAPLEFEQGHVRTAVVYVGGGLAGSLGASIFDDASLLVGASGGIYALLISQISHILLNYKTLRYVAHRSLAVALLALADVLYICYHIHVFNNESPRIGLAAHFAGALSGLLLGTLFFNGTVKWTNYIHTISAVIVIILHVSAVIFNLLRGNLCNVR